MRSLVPVVAVLVLAGGCSSSTDGRVTVATLSGEPPSEIPSLLDVDPAGAIVSFDGCHFEGDGRWSFTGSIELPEGLAEATFVVTVGWPLYSDEGHDADVRRIVTVVGGGDFVVEFSADETSQGRQATTAPTGSVFDELCLLGVSRGTVGVVERGHRAGPTSAEVPGPRVVVDGRLLPGPDDRPPRSPDLVGWLTGLTPEPGFASEPERDHPNPGTWGPAMLEIDGEDHHLPAGTPSGAGACGMVVVFNELGGDGGDGAGATACFVVAGLEADGGIEWISVFSGPHFDWSPETGWDAALDPGPTVDLGGVAQIEDGSVILEGVMPLRLPLAGDVEVDCAERGLHELDVIPGHLVGTATVDVASGRVVGLGCESLSAG